MILSFPSALHFGGGGAVDWVAHMVVGSVINGLIFGLIFRLIRNLSTPELIALVAVAVTGIFFWARARDRTRW